MTKKQYDRLVVLIKEYHHDGTDKKYREMLSAFAKNDLVDIVMSIRSLNRRGIKIVW